MPVSGACCAVRRASDLSSLVPTCSVPSRAKGNQLYVAELDRIVLKDSASQRPFASTATCRKSVITTRILQLVSAALQAPPRSHSYYRMTFQVALKCIHLHNGPNSKNGWSFESAGA